jgi:hypothetical protein
MPPTIVLATCGFCDPSVTPPSTVAVPGGTGGAPAVTSNGGAGGSLGMGGTSAAPGDAGATPAVDAGGLVDAGASTDAGAPFEPEPDGLIVLALRGFQSGN